MTRSHLVDGYLALTRQALTPPLALRERVLARLDAGALPLAESGAAGGLAGGAAPGALVPVAAASQGARGQLAALLGGGLLVLGFLGGYWARGIDGQPPPLPARAAPAAQEALQEELMPHEPALLQANPRSRSARSTPRTSDPARSNTPSQLATPLPATPSATRDELLLLQRTERAVRAGNSALALMLLGELETRYPRTELLEERRALELLAYCVADASDSAQRAERFLREHPRSVYAERIGALCPTEPARSAP